MISDIILYFVLLAAGFILLVKGADFLVEGASALALKLSVSELVIGLTIVAFGTSAPELIVSIMAGIGNNPDMALGNVAGSNILNILLILGVAGIINTLETKKNTVWKEIPFSLLAAIVLFVICNDTVLDGAQNMISRSDGLVLLIFFLIFLIYTFGISKVNIDAGNNVKPLPGYKTALFIVIGLAGLFAGGQLVVKNAVNIAKIFSVSDRLIGLTIVATGTSLPELFTSAAAAIKKKSDIAVGNIVGSNIFNIFLVLGVSAVIRPLPFDRAMNPDLLALIAASLILFLTMFTGKKRSLDRWEAVLFLVFYMIYNIFLFIRK